MKGGSRQAAEGTARVLLRTGEGVRARVLAAGAEGGRPVALGVLRPATQTGNVSIQLAACPQLRSAGTHQCAWKQDSRQKKARSHPAPQERRQQRKARSGRVTLVRACSARAKRRSMGVRTVVGSLGGAVAVDLQARGALEALGAVRVATPARDAPVHRHPAAQRNAAAADRAGRGPGRRAHASARAQRTAALPAGQPTAEDTRRALRPGSARRRRSGAFAPRGAASARRTCAGRCLRRASPCRRA